MGHVHVTVDIDNDAAVRGMMQTTVGQLLINSELPEHLRDYNRVLDKKGVQNLLEQVASENDPAMYRKVVQSLHQIGQLSAQTFGSSFSLKDFKTPPKTKLMTDQLKAKINEVVEREDLTDEQKDEALKAMTLHATPLLEDTMINELNASGNPFGTQLISGARGGKGDVRSLLIGDLLVVDHKQRTIPVPITTSMSTGYSPADYWASSYGARYGTLATKLATQRSGFLGKQLIQAAHKQVVTAHDCGTDQGIPVDANDGDNIGTVLAKDYGDFKAGTPIDPKMHKMLAEQSPDKKIYVRSALTCEATNGVCARCAGIRERGTYPEIGDNLGVAAAQALAEKVSQGALSCLVQGTKVRMADMTARCIEDIRVGDIVLGSDIKGITFPVKVIAVHDQGMQPVQTYEYASGYTKARLTLTCTADHPVLSNTRKSSCVESALNYTLRKLPAGYKCHDLAAVLPTETTLDGNVHEPLAMLVGMWIGDGCRAARTPILSCADLTLASDINKYLLPFAMHMTKCKRSYDWRISNTVVYNGDHTPNRFRVVLDRLGLTGKYAHEKTIAAEVWTWDRSSVAALIAGYIATDGSVSRTKDGWVSIHFGSTSRQLMQDIKDLLQWRLCIYSGSITCHGKAGTNNRKHDIWGFNISVRGEVDRLYHRLPALLGVKGPRYTKYITEMRYTGYGKAFTRCIRKTVTDAGTQQCWDLSVDHPDELFVLANGLIVKNTKHGGGRAKGNESNTPTGFKLINQMVQVPKTFTGGAAVSKLDGVVQEVRDAPQGGKHVLVGDVEHYIPIGLEPLVKPGQRVEQGDLMSEGIPNPAELVEHLGIGAGRLNFVHSFKKAFKDSGMNANRRNIEILTRGLVNHVHLTESDGVDNGLPGDLVEYSAISRNYRPRYGFKVARPAAVVGHYLERPVNQYSIGTRITKRVADDLNQSGVQQVTAHAEPAPFQPKMIRAMEQSLVSPDWQTRLGGSYMERGLLESLHKGIPSAEHSTSYIPALAKGVGFGEKLKTEGVY